jgi:hypothetical protein
MTGFPESKLDWLVEKFENHKGWFNAGDVRKKEDKKYKNPDWQKLMSLAVERGLAYSSDCYRNAPKDSIALNLPEIPDFFDKYIFEDHYFICMPDMLFSTMEWSKDSDEFYHCFYKWCNVHNLLCGLQYRELFDEQLLGEIPDETKRYLVWEAKEISSIYKLIKFGWAEILEGGYFSEHKEICPANYNELFLRILWDRFKRSVLKTRYRKPNDQSDRTKLRLAQGIEDPCNINIECHLDENIDRLRKFTGEQDDDTYYALYDLTISAGCYSIREILKDSANPTVIEALKELKSIVREEKKACLKKLRKKVDKKPSCKNLNPV